LPFTTQPVSATAQIRLPVGSRGSDWDHLRRAVIGQIVWEDLTGSDPFLSPAFTRLTDAKARVRLRYISQQFRAHITTGKVTFGPVVDAYRDRVLDRLG
jgi:hypothetical protein